MQQACYARPHVLPEGKLYNNVFNEVGKVMQHSITFNKTQYHLNGAMEDWCNINVGKGGWLPGFIGHEDDVWSINSAFGNTAFRFKNEKDYAWFVLRWGS